jgi:hypothetical protein
MVLPEVAVWNLALCQEPRHVEMLALVGVDAPVDHDPDSQSQTQRHERGEDPRSQPTHGEAHHTADMVRSGRSPGAVSKDETLRVDAKRLGRSPGPDARSAFCTWFAHDGPEPPGGMR